MGERDKIEEASCAHRRVVANPWTNDDGTKSDRWECDSCGCLFEPSASLRSRADDLELIALNLKATATRRLLCGYGGRSWSYFDSDGRPIPLDTDVTGLPLLTPEARAALKRGQP